MEVLATASHRQDNNGSVGSSYNHRQDNNGSVEAASIRQDNNGSVGYSKGRTLSWQNYICVCRLSGSLSMLQKVEAGVISWHWLQSPWSYAIHSVVYLFTSIYNYCGQ
ncbi:hypothetical protein BsWGS_18450 [Bradybaena similaris]